MNCLKCKKSMQKSIFDGVLIDFCQECKSLWLDKDEFDNIVSKQEYNSSSLVAEAKHEGIVELTRRIEWAGENICPKCFEGRMRPFTKFGVSLDRCELCEGVFFENGEFQKCYDLATESFIGRMWRHIKDIF